jgi:hypothetical protein
VRYEKINPELITQFYLRPHRPGASLANEIVAREVYEIRRVGDAFFHRARQNRVPERVDFGGRNRFPSPLKRVARKYLHRLATEGVGPFDRPAQSPRSGDVGS